MEREALALLPDGIPGDVSYANVRRHVDAGVSRPAEDAAPLPHEAEQLARLLQQARVTKYADLLAELGAQNAEDLSFMTAPELAPMPIIHAKRLIRRSAGS